MQEHSLLSREGQPGDQEVGVDTSVARKGKILNALWPLESLLLLQAPLIFLQQ